METDNNKLIISDTGGLIGRVDRQVELTRRLLKEIEIGRSELIVSTRSLSELRAGEEREFEIAAGLKMRFCWCPPGSFKMGSPDIEEGRCEDENQVNVILSKGFWIGKYQTTQEQWMAVMGSNPSHFKGEKLPVDTVSWNNAQKFIKKVNIFLASSTGGELALPTEAQWEYAARAGQTGQCTGSTVDEIGWYYYNSHFSTHPVGTKNANAWGMHDMIGNVREWCADIYKDSLDGGIDPTGPESGVNRVCRGSSWTGSVSELRLARRDFFGPKVAWNSFGVRFVLCFGQ
jgi:formylglycine-generating enzyme required for sulfatase activity